ncbi:MAG: ThiF family adenylyltransferase [Thermoanaerobaculia bacterium]
MSHPLISRDPHLQQLVNEGYSLELRSNHLLVHDVPFVNSARQVFEDGVLVMPLAGESSTIPPNHTAHFIGAHPCSMDGAELVQIKNESRKQSLAPGLEVDHLFSAKPRDNNGKYPNFHAKVTLYVQIISGPAQALRPGVTAQRFRPIASVDEDSVFLYMDTASTRAGILAASKRFHGLKIAIVGLGGTGAYVLDMVAKTPVAEIHLFDGDICHQHNAFRVPGAMSLDELKAARKKVDHLQSVYSKMRRGVVPHPEMITPDNVRHLRDFDHVFLCVDKGSVRQWVVGALRGSRTTLFDTGMGVHIDEETQKVYGICRVSVLAEQRHAHAERCIPMVDQEDIGIYRNNVQIADLNALNATFAVVRWKKACGFYASNGCEYDMAYTIETNIMTCGEVVL